MNSVFHDVEEEVLCQILGIFELTLIFVFEMQSYEILAILVEVPDNPARLLRLLSVVDNPGRGEGESHHVDRF